MTTHGIVEIRTTSLANYAHYGEHYVSFCNFLSSSQAQSIGISRIAYNKGAGANGTGLDYPGSANSVGNNAWSVWCWLSASIPFYMLLQVCSASAGMNATPGSPGSFINGGGSNGIGVTFAYRGDGSSPWNGTTNNNGTDTKGTIVWQTGSAVAPSGTLYVFPRGNSGGGSFASQRQLLGSVVVADQLQSFRCHLLADEDNVLFLTDSAIDNVYAMNFFGKIRSRASGDSPTYINIASMSEFGSDGLPRGIDTSTYGTTTYSTTADGGISYSWSDSKISGSLGCLLGVLGEIFTTTLQPNLTTQPLSYDTMPLEVFYNETPRYGYAGSVDFFKLVYGISTHDTNATLTSASFGAATATAAHKLIVPWDGVTTPGGGASRTGSIF